MALQPSSARQRSKHSWLLAASNRMPDTRSLPARSTFWINSPQGKPLLVEASASAAVWCTSGSRVHTTSSRTVLPFRCIVTLHQKGEQSRLTPTPRDPSRPPKAAPATAAAAPPPRTAPSTLTAMVGAQDYCVFELGAPQMPPWAELQPCILDVCTDITTPLTNAQLPRVPVTDGHACGNSSARILFPRTGSMPARTPLHTCGK